MVASEFIDDIARGSSAWDALSSVGTRERMGADVDRPVRAPSMNADRPSVTKRPLTSSIFIEDALING
ncbi:MAG TPA: hypothetical protein VGG17_03000 [Acidimicrobiales bacterium]|jgi:hypothetical protein